MPSTIFAPKPTATSTSIRRNKQGKKRIESVLNLAQAVILFCAMYLIRFEPSLLFFLT